MPMIYTVRCRYSEAAPGMGNVSRVSKKASMCGKRPMTGL